MNSSGQVAILNVGEGDTRLSFNPEEPAECERAQRVVGDMLRLGYAIMVKVGDEWRRAKAFDPTHAEYLIADTPAQAAVAPSKRKPKRVRAAATRAISIGRTAGGMAAPDDSRSAELLNVERFDNHAEVRNNLRKLAAGVSEWAGIPMPLADQRLIVEPRYRFAQVLNEIEPPPDDADKHESAKFRNSFYSHKAHGYVLIFEENGKLEWGISRNAGMDIQLRTLGASIAWGIEQESNALQTLAELIPHHAFKQYVLTGSFLESSPRSNVTYMFRRLRPTVAMSTRDEQIRVMAALCMHPVAYYADSFAGAMTPTDDVVSHLMMMRGDEPMFWRRCNQHPASHPEAGII